MPDLLVILFKSCGKDCDDILKQINEPSMRKYLKETFDINRVKELHAESDDLASQIMISTQDYELPILAVLKEKKKVCTFRLDPVEIKECVDLKDIPKE